LSGAEAELLADVLIVSDEVRRGERRRVEAFDERRAEGGVAFGQVKMFEGFSRQRRDLHGSSNR
jgi:hypothetical protein